MRGGQPDAIWGLEVLCKTRNTQFPGARQILAGPQLAAGGGAAEPCLLSRSQGVCLLLTDTAADGGLAQLTGVSWTRLYQDRRGERPQLCVHSNDCHKQGDVLNPVSQECERPGHVGARVAASGGERGEAHQVCWPASWVHQTAVPNTLWLPGATGPWQCWCR